MFVYSDVILNFHQGWLKALQSHCVKTGVFYFPNVFLRKLLFFANPAFLLGRTIHNVSAPKAKHQSAETDYNINRHICANLHLCCIVVTAAVKTALSTAATMVFDSEGTNLSQTWRIFCIFRLLKSRAETSYDILVLCLIICWEMG